MLMPWDKAKLLTDSSAMEIARITEILKQNNIEYDVRLDEVGVGYISEDIKRPGKNDKIQE